MSQHETITQAREALASGEVSSEELVEQALKNIDTWDTHINAFLEVLGDEARAAARQWDKGSPDRPLFVRQKYAACARCLGCCFAAL